MNPNPIDILTSSMSSTGMTAQLKRRLPDGTYIDATDAQVKALGTQAKISSTASALQHLSAAERTQWAIDMKNTANGFYENEKYIEAMELYLQSITAANFGTSSKDETNVDELVIPALCNLCACAMKLSEWNKCIKFADQALLLKSDCFKAYSRRGQAYMHLGNYAKASADYQRALEVTTNDIDIQRIRVLMDQNARHSAAAAQANSKHKQAMSKAFVMTEADDRVAEKEKRIEEQKKKEELREEKRKKLQKPKTLNVVVITIAVFGAALVLFLWTRKLFVANNSDTHTPHNKLGGEF